MSSTLLGTLGVRLDALTADFEKKMTQAQSKIEGISATAKKVSIASGAAFAAMAAGLAVVSKAFDTQIRAERGLAAAFSARGEAADVEGIKTLASELQALTTIGDEVSLSAAKMLVPFGATDEAIKQLLPGLLDLSAGMEIGLATATAAAGKALSGQAGALSRYVGKLTDAQTETLQLGDAQQKVAVIAEVLAKFQGQAALAASTATGRFAQMKNEMGDVLEKLGGLVDTPLAAVLKGVTDSVGKLNGFIAGLSDNTKKWLGIGALAATGLAGITTAVAALIAALPLLLAGFTAFAAVVPPILAISAGLFIAVAAVGALGQAWDTNMGGIQEKAKTVADFVAWIWDKQMQAVSAIVKFTVKQIVTVFNGLIKTLNFVIENMNKAAQVVNKLTGKDLSIDFRFGEIETGGGGLPAALDTALGVVGIAGKDAAKTLGESFKAGLVRMFGDLGGPIDELVKKFQGMIEKVDEAGNAISPAGGGGLAGPAQPTGGQMDRRLPTLGKSTGTSQGNLTTAVDQLSGAGQELINGMGQFGNTLNAVTEASAAGPQAAAVAAITSLLMQTASFKNIVKMVNLVLEKFIKVIDQILQPMMPAIEVLIELASVLLFFLIQLNPFVLLWRAIGIALGLLAPLIERVTDTITSVWHWIVGVLQDFARKIPGIGDDIADFLNQFRLDFDNIVGNPAVGAGDAFGDTAPRVDDFGDSLDGVGGMMQEAAESLSNVPAGFKIAAERFAAISPGDVGGTVGTTAEQERFAIGTVMVVADDPSTFAEKLKRESDWKRVADEGTSIALAPRFVGAELGK